MVPETEPWKRRENGPTASVEGGPTTHRAVSDADNLADFVSKLYRFALKREAYQPQTRDQNRRVPRLPSAARNEELAETVAELVTTLLEEARELSREHPDWPELACAHAALRRLRAPRSGATVRKRSGFRQRVVTHLLREVLGRGGPLPLTLEPAARDDAQSEVSTPGLGDLPPAQLAEIRETLAGAWSKVSALVAEKICKQPKTRLRRLAAIDVLCGLAREQAPHGVVSDHFERVVATTPARVIVAALRKRKIGPLRRLTDDKLREDIRIVKKALLAELDFIKSKEGELRTKLLAVWARDYVTAALASARPDQN